MNQKKEMLEQIIATIVEAGWVVANEPDQILHRTFPDYRCESNEWELFVNGNNEPRKVKAREGMTITLEPFHFAVFWNGWLAALFNPAGGSFAAHPTGANAETFQKSLSEMIGEDEIEPNRSPVPGPEAA